MDGNGRWANERGQERTFGHQAGVETVKKITAECVRLGVKFLTLYTFSTENWNRPQDEVNGLMELMLKSVLGERETFRKNNIRFRVIGDRSRLSGQLLENIDMVQDETASYTGLTLIVMLSYSGKWDILQASRRYAADCLAAGKELPLDETGFAAYLATAGIPDPDLMIRTSGEQRISNYMLWQCAYTEFYYTPVLWPDFRKNDLELAIQSYNRRERRYGKVE